MTKTELGNATVNFTGPIVTIAPGGTSFSAQIGGTAIANPDGYALGVATFDLTVAFTNLSGRDLDFIIVDTQFSAFNPFSGGPRVGARVDDSTLEFARFSSSLRGPPIVGDSHQCDTRNAPSHSSRRLRHRPRVVSINPIFRKATFRSLPLIRMKP